MESKKTIEDMGELLKTRDYDIWFIDEESDKYIQLRGKRDLCMSFNAKNYIENITEYTFENNNYYIFKYPGNVFIIIQVPYNKEEIIGKDLKDAYELMFNMYVDEVFGWLDNKIHTILKTFEEVNKPSEPENMMRKIIEGALEIMPNLDSGFIQMYDEPKETLNVRYAVGFDDAIYSFRGDLLKTINGHVYIDGREKIFNSRGEIADYIELNSLGFDGLSEVEKSRGKKSLKKMISLPIKYKGKCFGVLSLHQFEEKPSIKERDLIYLKAFASQAAITIENIRLIKSLNENIENMEDLNRDLDAKNKAIAKKNELYNNLNKLSLEGYGIEKMVEVMSKIMDLDIICLNDIERNVIYNNVSTAIKLEELWNFVDAGDIYTDRVDGQKLYKYLIKNDKVIYGYILINEDLSEDIIKRELLKEAITMLTVEMMRVFSITDLLYKRQHKYFNRLISTNSISELKTYASKLKIPEGKCYLSVIFEINEYEDLEILESDLHSIISIISKAFINYRTLIYGFHNRVNLIIIGNCEDNIGEVELKIKNILNTWEKEKNNRLIASIGSHYTGIENIKHSHNEADKGIKYVETQKYINFIKYEDIGINNLFINQDPKDIRVFLEDTLGELYTVDKERNRTLLDTLRKYVENNRSATKTAEELFIHINTLYQRFTSIEEMIEIDFDNPEDNLKIELACYLLRQDLI